MVCVSLCEIRHTAMLPQESNIKKKNLSAIVKTEFDYISNFFDVLDLASLNHGKRNYIDEENELLEMENVTEKKLLKHGMKKSQTNKMKAFPHTIDGLEKELEELKGKSMTYQLKLRKKGLQTRLVKKKRRDTIKQQKVATKLQKKSNLVSNGPNKLVKPVFNSDGKIVSNKFDFADNKTKKDNKRKLGTVRNEIGQESKVVIIDNQADVKSGKTGTYVSNSSVVSDKSVTNIKQENKQDSIQKIKGEVSKTSSHEGPVFNKENKMVFSKIYLPENNRKPKKKTEKDPKKILQKIKENSKKISEIEKEDKNKAASLKEKEKWASALKRASGEKVKDDPELLRKSITREKNKKLQSQKKWQARIDRVQKEKDDKQKKRTENIQARKNEKKKKKFKKAVKKGSFVQV